MSFENYTNSEKFSVAECLNLFDSIPEHRLKVVYALSNNVGWDLDVFRNTIEITLEDSPEKTKRIGELLTLLSQQIKYGEDVEKTEIPEKVNELINLVK